MSTPLAYFITFTTYGTWLHGRNPASVDREHNVPGTPYLLPNRAIEQSRCESLRQDPYFLDGPRQALVLQTIQEVAAHRHWRLWAAHVRTNHVHIVITAPSRPEKVMSDLKAWISRKLREAFQEPPDRDRWTQHGSTRWLNTHESLLAAIEYVVEEQGTPMAHFDGRPHEPEAYEPEA